MIKQLHVNNHFVPKSYLKRWEDTSKKVTVYKTLVSHSNVPVWKKYSTSAIAYHRHLYTLIINNEESDELENWFEKEFENPANEVIDKVTNDQRLSKDDWNVLIKFLASQDVRTPTRMIEHLKRYSESYESVIQKVAEEVKEALINKSLPISINESKNTEFGSNRIPLKLTTKFEPDQDIGNLKIESYVGRVTWLNSIKYLLENTEKILHTHKWTIVKPAKGFYWFTSDNPVVKLNFYDDKNYDFGGGWGKEKGNIIFPLGPEHAMFVQIGDKPISKGSRVSINQTILIRKMIAENSHRMIFSKFEDEEILKLKKRIINDQQLQNEKMEMLKWHEQNAELEREYFKVKADKS